MTREEYDDNIYYANNLDEEWVFVNQYIDSLEAKITGLEYEGQLQWDTHQMCQIINLKRITELEAQNKALTDMVEVQSEKISRLEAPKSCEGCKWDNTGMWSICISCIRKPKIKDCYEPKGN